MKPSKKKMRYKGYIGEYSYDEDLDIFKGSIINIKYLVLFQGKSIEAFRSDFHDAINDYLNWKERQGTR